MSTRAAAVALALALALLLPPAAAPAHDGGEMHGPTVSFLEEGTLELDWDADAIEDGLTVTVRNDATTEQKITVDLAGLGEALPKTFTTPEAIAARTAEAVVIPLVDGAVRPDGAQTYEGAIVISGETGAPVRRAATLTVTGEDAPPRGEALSPTDLSGQTLPATNFVPSFLNPYGPTLIVVAFILAVIAWWWRPTAPVRRLLLALAFSVCLLFGIYGNTFYDRDAQDGWEAISPKSLPLSGVENGTYGAVTTDEADIAEIFVDDSRLSVRGLDRAGGYTGKVDLTPGAEKGDASLTVNVRDWWLYAIFVLTAGVIVGYLFRRLLDHVLPRRTLLRDVDAVVARHADLDGPYSLAPRIKRERAAILEKAGRDVEAARKDLDALEALVDEYAELRVDLERLRDERKAVAGEATDAEAVAGPIPISAINTVAEADALLARPLGTGDAKDLEARRGAVQTATKDLQEVRVLAAAIRAALGDAPGNQTLKDLLRRAFVHGDRKKVQEDLDLVDHPAAATVEDTATELQLLRFRPGADLVTVHGGGGPPEEPAAADTAPDSGAALARETQRATSLAGALAVASGFSLLYFEDGVWGTPRDYVAAFVWGAAGAEALKVVMSFAVGRRAAAG